jgi:hypothetical protein
MKFLLLQFRHEITTQGCRESGGDLRELSTHFLDSKNERQRISPTQSSETLTPRDEIFRMKRMKRREFLTRAAICSAASVMPSALAQQQPTSLPQENGSMNQIPFVASPGTRSGDMLCRALGRTGERVSAIGMGGFHLAQHGLTEEESIRLVRAAIDRGITFMDNSWDYSEGQSELRMGKALKDGHRQKVF